MKNNQYCPTEAELLNTGFVRKVEDKGKIKWIRTIKPHTDQPKFIIYVEISNMWRYWRYYLQIHNIEEIETIIKVYSRA